MTNRDSNWRRCLVGDHAQRWHAGRLPAHELGPRTQHSSTCTQVFEDLGLAHNAEVEFRVLSSSHIELLQVLHSGTPRTGATNNRQTSAAPAAPARKMPSRSALDGREASRDTHAVQFPFDDRPEIVRLAETYWALISARDALAERQFDLELREAREAGFLSKPLFVRLARWKSVRKTPDYESNSAESVRRATATALKADSDAAALQALTALRGVGLRTASAILHWMRPDRFPILDYRVLEALDEPEPSSYEDCSFYSRIADQIRALAGRHALDLRTVDRAMWAWSKAQSRT